MDGLVGKSEDGDSGGHRARLRKRLLDAGPDGFHDYELVEYLLALTIPRVDTKPLAKRLIHDFGGIGPLLSASADTLRNEGLTDPTIAAIKIAEATALRLLETRLNSGPSCRAGKRSATISTPPWPIGGPRKCGSCSSTRRKRLCLPLPKLTARANRRRVCVFTDTLNSPASGRNKARASSGRKPSRKPYARSKTI